MKSHESWEAERFAKLAHWLAFGLSAFTAAWGLGGCWWHWWAARQHIAAMRYLKHDREHGL